MSQQELEQNQINVSNSGHQSAKKPLAKQFVHYLMIMATLVLLAFTITIVQYNLQQQHQQQNKLLLESIQSEHNELSLLSSMSLTLQDLLNKTSAQQIPSAYQVYIQLNDELAQLNSPYKAKYQQWQLTNKRFIHLTERLQGGSDRNERLKEESLALLILLEKQLANAGDEKVIETSLIKQWGIIIDEFEQLDLTMSLVHFSALKFQLSTNLEKLALVKEQLALTSVDFIESLNELNKLLYLEQAAMAKWHGHLRLANQFQQQLLIQQEKLNSILTTVINQEVVTTSATIKSDFLFGLLNENNLIPINELIVIVLVITFLLLIMLAVLWYRKIKLISVSLVHLVEQAITNKENKSLKSHYCEMDIVVDKIYQLKATIPEQYELTQQQEQVRKQAQKVRELQHKQDTLCEQLRDISSQKEYQVTEKIKQLYQQSKDTREALWLIIQQQINHHVSDNTLGNQNVPSTRGINQLDKLVEQWQLCAELQLGQRKLRLSSVNIADEISASLINMRSHFIDKNNHIKVKMSEQIIPRVTLDAKVFTQFIQVVIQLLLSDKNNTSTLLAFSLHDKSSGQQHIQLRASVNESKSGKLPIELQRLQQNQQSSSLLVYFNVLLHQIHAKEPIVSLTEKGYQLTLQFPIAMSGENKLEEIINSGVKVKSQVDIDVSNLYNPNFEEMSFFTADQPVNNKFYALPLFILVATHELEPQKKLIALLIWMGFQVEIVSQQATQDELWRTGKYSILFSAFDQSPFVSFLSENQLNEVTLRGAFSLGKSTYTTTKKAFSSWRLAQIPADVTLTSLVKILSPWLDKINSAKPVRQVESQCDNAQLTMKPVANETTNLSTQGKPASCFNFDVYVNHQGSPEHAFFMLEEYLQSLSANVDKLTKVLKNGNQGEAHIIVKQLKLDATIMAAPVLHKLCFHWEALLSSQSELNNQVLVSKLLMKTERAVNSLKEAALKV